MDILQANGVSDRQWVGQLAIGGGKLISVGHDTGGSRGVGMRVEPTIARSTSACVQLARATKSATPANNRQASGYVRVTEGVVLKHSLEPKNT